MNRAWWDDVLARAGRQVVQVLTPLLLAMAAGSAGGFTMQGVLLAAAAAATVTVVKAIAGITSDPADPWWLQAVERAAAAVCGALAAYLVAGPATDLLTLPWHAIGWSVAGAAALALLGMVTNPPKANVVDLDAVRRARRASNAKAA